MNKETTGRVSTIAAELMRLTLPEFRSIANEEAGAQPIQNFLNDVRSVAASCMSQDETPGQETPTGDFHSRLKDERTDLDRRLTALNSYLTHNPGHPSPRHNAMLTEQVRLMSELLAILDEEIPIGNEDDGA